jgi:hypothetical protein
MTSLIVCRRLPVLCSPYEDIRFEVFTAVNIHILWIMTVYNLLGNLYQRFGFHLQGKYLMSLRNAVINLQEYVLIHETTTGNTTLVLSYVTP